MSEKLGKKEKKDEVNEKATPLASQDLTKTILDFIREVSSYKDCLKRGANEVTKSLNRGRARLVVLAADANPLEILLHLPLLCEDKNVQYIFIRSGQSLGRACGISRGVIACSILENPKNELLKKKTFQLIDEVERFIL